MSVAFDSGNTQNVLTMSSVYMNMFRTVERLVEDQERQIELQQQQLEMIGKGFERLVHCISQNASEFMEQSAFSAQSACGLPLLWQYKK